MSDSLIADWLTSYSSQIAAEITTRLLDAAGARVARQFKGDPRTQALRDALSEGLFQALARFPITPELRDHYSSLFQKGLQREAVIGELSLIIDPRPDTPLDLKLLYAEFVEAGFDPHYLPEIAFEDFMQAFVAAFYRAAKKRDELQGLIQIGLLERLADDSGAMRDSAQRTANATEEIVELLTQSLRGAKDLMPQVVEKARERAALPQPGTAFDTYQQVAAGLGRAGLYVSVSPDGRIELAQYGVSGDGSGADLGSLTQVLQELHTKLAHPDDQPTAQELAARETRYRQLLASMYKDLRFEGLSTTVQPIVLPLERVYVHLRAVAEVPEAADEFTPEERRLLRLLEEGGRVEDLREAHLRLDAIRRERWTKDGLERFPIAQSLRDPERRGLVILGDPGSGKTTLLHFLALVFAQGDAKVSEHLCIQGAEAQRLPIFAPLAAYDSMLDEEACNLTVQEFLPRYYDRRQAAPGLWPLFDSALRAGRALVLLDGLDEVVDEGRRKFVAEQVSAFVRDAIRHGNRVLVTSRIYGYRVAPLSVPLPHVTVLDFHRDAIETFVRQWSRAIAEWEAGGRLSVQSELAAQTDERRLLEEIRCNPGIERLAVNPLLLTMLALLRRQVGKLPQRRIQLYDLYVQASIQHWEENRSRGARLKTPQRIDTLEAENVLIPLSLWLQQNKPSGTATRPELMQQLCSAYLCDLGEDPDSPSIPIASMREAERRAQKFLEDMRQFSGVLVERGQNAFGFRHLTFQEYFAGRALARMAAEERWSLLKPQLHANRWHEPILLAAARLGSTENRGSEASALVERILDAGSEYEAVIRRDLFLAADCAADDINIGLPILRRLVGQLAPVALSRIPSFSLQAVRCLVRLALLLAGDRPRLPEAADALVAVLRQPAGRLMANLSAVAEAIAPCLPLYPQLDMGLKALLDDKDPDTRQVAIRALAGLLGTDEALRGRIAALLDDKDFSVRWAAIRALAGLLGTDEALRGRITALLDDKAPGVRWAAIQALAGLLGTDEALRGRITALIEDDSWAIRAAAITALAPLAATDEALCRKLLPALGIDDDADSQRTLFLLYRSPESTPRRALVRSLTEAVRNSKSLRTELSELLSSPDRNLRLSAAEILGGAGTLVIREVLPQLITAIDDDRGFDSWPARLAAAEILLNEPQYCEQAIEAIGAALDYGTHPLAVVQNDSEVRQQAALALGRLKAEHRRTSVFARLQRLLDEEQDPQVLDSAFSALQSLAAAPEIE